MECRKYDPRRCDAGGLCSLGHLGAELGRAEILVELRDADVDRVVFFADQLPVALVEPIVCHPPVLAAVVEPARSRGGVCVELRNVGLDVDKRCSVEDVQPANPEHVAVPTEQLDGR